MMTGDRMDTSENIGKSCSLIEPEMEIFHLK
jgi:magnesium-transporting ATPase (P-type)